MKVSCLSFACFRLFLFNQSSLLFSSYFLVYLSTFPSKQKLKTDVSLAKKSVKFFSKMLILILTFQDEGQFYANWFSYILIIWRKCLAFQLLSGGIRMCFPILTGVETWRSTSWKTNLIFLKFFDFESQFTRWRSVLCQFLVL